MLAFIASSDFVNHCKMLLHIFPEEALLCRGFSASSDSLLRTCGGAGFRVWVCLQAALNLGFIIYFLPAVLVFYTSAIVSPTSTVTFLAYIHMRSSQRLLP